MFFNAGLHYGQGSCRAEGTYRGKVFLKVEGIVVQREKSNSPISGKNSGHSRRQSRPRVRKIRHLFIVVTAVLLLAPASPSVAYTGNDGEGSNPLSLADLDRAQKHLDAVVAPLTMEQYGPGMVTTFSGSAKSNGYVLAELIPSSEERRALKSGDEYHGVVFAAAEVDRRGSFSLALNQNDQRIDYRPGTAIWLWFLDENGVLVGADTANIPDRGEIAQVSLREDTSKSGGWLRPSDGGVDTDQAPRGDGTVEFHEDWCHWYVVDHNVGGGVRTTLAVTGSNTNAASYKVEITESQSSKLGIAVKVGNGSWFEGSGSWTQSNVAGTGLTWNARSAYGTFSYRTNIQYAKERYECFSGVTERVVPHDSTGARFSPVRWRNSQYPTHCVFQAADGSFTLNRSTATNWQGGVKLSWEGVGSVNADSQTGYSNSSKITHSYTRDAYLCGRNANPGSSSTPGYIISDWKDR